MPQSTTLHFWEKGFQNSSVNGAASTQNNYQMDGASIVNWSGSGSLTESGSFAGIAIPTPDAIQEFKIQTSTFDAGYGRNAGANVNVVSKSGTNDFHGTAFEFFRNTVLNSNDFFNEYSQLSQGKPNSAPVLNQNQFGGVVGGPVKKDKLFFFLGLSTDVPEEWAFRPYGFSTGISLPADSRRQSRHVSPWGHVASAVRRRHAKHLRAGVGGGNFAALPGFTCG